VEELKALHMIVLTLFLFLVLFPIQNTLSETIPHETSISLFFDSNLVTLGSNVTIKGTISPPLLTNVTIDIYTIFGVDYTWNTLGEHLVNTESNGSFFFTWKPLGRGTYCIVALWEGNQSFFGSKSKIQEIRVIGGAGPSWLEVGTYLNYCHSLNGNLKYIFVGSERTSSPSPEVPMDFVLVRYGGFFGNGPMCYINMTNRDVHRIIDRENQNTKTQLWINPNITLGDSVKIFGDEYSVVDSGHVTYQGTIRECWVLENPYRTLWYDKKLGILMKGTNFVWDGVEYPYSMTLYDTNILFDSSISLQVDPSLSYLGSSINISGYLTPNLTTSIQIQWSLDQERWYTFKVTSTSGFYSDSWFPPSSGKIYLRAYWEGDETYAETSSSEVTVTVFSSQQEQILNQTYTEYKQLHSHSNDEYNDLLSEYNSLKTELDPMKTLNYILIGTTIAFIIITVYFVKKKV